MKINEHDMTKRMMEVMRGGFLREETESNDVITPAPNSPEYKDEAKKLADSVDPRVQITKFKIYPRDRNVEFEGRLDSGINFFMSTQAMKLSISVTDTEGQAIKIYVDNELLATLQKLNGYYQNWSREWAQKLATDYQAQ